MAKRSFDSEYFLKNFSLCHNYVPSFKRSDGGGKILFFLADSAFPLGFNFLIIY